jgi:hypothetical protein
MGKKAIVEYYKHYDGISLTELRKTTKISVGIANVLTDILTEYFLKYNPRALHYPISFVTCIIIPSM